MWYDKSVSAIILCAGNSIRFGTNRNKNLEKVNNKFILSYSLKEFDKNNYIDDIILAVREEDILIIKDIVKNGNFSKKISFVLGGKERKESSYNCIKSSNSDIVIIHDAARPLIKQEYISKCIENMNDYKGVTVAVKSKDTIKITDDNNLVTSTTKRSNTWIVQTPQCFDRNVLLSQYIKYKDDININEECILLEKDNIPVRIVEGDYTNIKLTTYEDLYIIEKFLNI